MIVRILSDAQYELDEKSAQGLLDLDAGLDQAVAAGDEAGFTKVLAEMVNLVHDKGRQLDLDRLVPSDLALPAASSSLAEVRALLASESPDS